ncbi:MAG: DNA-binding protein [Desulfurococcaceae archaeon]
MLAAHFTRIPEGSDVHGFLRDFIVQNKLRRGLIIGIGGLEYAEVGYFNPVTKSYSSVVVKADDTVVEVGSLLGNYVVDENGNVRIHVHVSLSKPGETYSGHLIKGVAKPFLEVYLLEAENAMEAQQ